jgi:hypothetical protein
MEALAAREVLAVESGVVKEDDPSQVGACWV